MSKVQLKLKLNSKVPTKVYATNGKHYMLQPGSNVLSLEYNDYISLTKALGIKTKDELQSKSAEKHEDTQKPAESTMKQSKSKVEDVKSAEPKLDELAPAEKDNHEDSTCNEDTCEQATEELHEDPAPVEDTPEPVAENVQEPVAEEPCDTDYTTMSYVQLKAEYKKVTGKSCKLKKDEIIAFLQEHNSDVE